MKLLLAAPLAVLALAGCASTSTTTSTPLPASTAPVQQLTALQVCGDHIDVLSQAADVMKAGTATPDQLKALSAQMKAVAATAPEPFNQQYASLAAMFDSPRLPDVDSFKLVGTKVTEECAAVIDGAKSAPEPPSGPTVIGEGTWTVGVDVDPGKYRTVAAVSDGCYWEITKAGTNGADIIANDNVTGGRPTVTLKKGQEFKNQGCGDFQKL